MSPQDLKPHDRNVCSAKPFLRGMPIRISTYFLFAGDGFPAHRKEVVKISPLWLPAWRTLWT